MVFCSRICEIVGLARFILYSSLLACPLLIFMLLFLPSIFLCILSTTDLVSVTATPPMEPAPVQQQQQQPATVRTHQLSPQRSNPAVGAFAIDVPAPVYAMGDDDNDNDEWERFPEEEFQTGRGGTTAAHHHHTSAVLEADIRPATLPTLVSDDNQQEEQDAAKSRTRWYIGGALCLVVVIVIVVVIVVVAGGGRGGGGGGNGLPETVLAPTPAPTPSLWAECFTSHRRLITLLLGRVNYDEFIDVELCPGTTYQVTEVERTEPAGGIEPVFTVQSNMRLKCGENGNLNDECVVTGRSGGRVLLLHTWALIQAQKVDTAENGTSCFHSHALLFALVRCWTFSTTCVSLNLPSILSFPLSNH